LPALFASGCGAAAAAPAQTQQRLAQAQPSTTPPNCQPPGVKRPHGSQPPSGPYAHTIVIDAIPGDANASGLALLNAMSNIWDASSTNRYLIKLSAGDFSLHSLKPFQATDLSINDYVDVEGAGPTATTLIGHSGSGMSFDLRNSELRSLRVQVISPDANNIAILCARATAALRDVALELPNAAAYTHGIVSAGCSLTVDGVSVVGNVVNDPTGQAGGSIWAVLVSGGTAAISDLQATIHCDGGSYCNGVLVEGQATATLRDSSITVDGVRRDTGSGVYVEKADLSLDSVAVVSSGSFTSAGLWGVMGNGAGTHKIDVGCSSIIAENDSLYLRNEASDLFQVNVNESMVVGRVQIDGPATLQCVGDYNITNTPLSATCQLQ
jgi:hypothetical protein